MIEKNQYKEMDRFQSAIIVSTNKYYVDHPVKLQITLKKNIYFQTIWPISVFQGVHICVISVHLRLICFLKAFRDLAIMGATPVNTHMTLRNTHTAPWPYSCRMCSINSESSKI